MIRKVVDSDYPIISKYYREFDDSNVNLYDIGPFTKIFVYECDNKIAGLINYSIIYDRAELEYIYVDKEYRGKHIASELMENLIVDAIDSGCLNITLEVSKNNLAGIKLYEKFGFKEKAIRKNYYKDGDGLLMMRELVNNE